MYHRYDFKYINIAKTNIFLMSTNCRGIDHHPIIINEKLNFKHYSTL